MKLFLDTANLQEIKEVVSWGILDGVTTNPTLCSKEKMAFEELVKEICRLVPGPVSLECVSTRAEDIVVEARKLSQIAPNVVIKIPINIEGLRATKILSAQGIKVNMTLIFLLLKPFWQPKPAQLLSAHLLAGWITFPTTEWNWWNRLSPSLKTII
jgi:Transaldolase